MVEWVKESNQDLIFLQLDFIKAFDVVSWDFLGQVMVKLGIPNSLSYLVFLLLSNVFATILLNGKATSSFSI